MTATTKEKLITCVLLLAFGTPVAIYTRDPLLGGLGAIVGVCVFQVVYWRVYHGVRLSEVYPTIAGLT